MRIWSLHPRYLDAKGLVALWRETLLAKHVLEGKTKGYRHHPQLRRFKESPDALGAINYYLEQVYQEALARAYAFDNTKFSTSALMPQKISVTRSQLKYEQHHLLRKLKVRDKTKYEELVNITEAKVHPLFTLVEGAVEPWEIINNNE